MRIDPGNKQCRKMNLLSICGNIYRSILITLMISRMTTGDENRGRHLIFPPPSDWAGTKLQLIVGLGLPMEIDVSTIVGYVMKFNYVLPYNASYFTDSYVRYQRSIDWHQDMAETTEVGHISRWEIYQMIESSLEGFSSGRGCLLRVICESAAVPFLKSHSIVAQLLHILFTPSTTLESCQNINDQEYCAAEESGKKNPNNCKEIFYECDENVLDYFTEILIY